MLRFRELVLEDKANFDRLLEGLQLDSSDYNFTNFYMWSHSYGLKGAHLPELDYWLLLARPTKWKPFFFAPPGDWSDEARLKEGVNLMKEIAREEGIQFFVRRVPEQFLEKLIRIEPGIHYREDQNTFDYLYTTESLDKLAGRKLHGKRNHLNQFLRKYQWQYRPMDQELVSQCLALETPWFALRQLNNAEDEAMHRVLANFAALKCQGGVLLVDDRIQAFTVGERLNRETAVIHIEKANTDYDGIYAAINQQFVHHEWLDLRYINREEDMGMDGLRQVKQSYHPFRMVKKFNVYL